MSSSCELKRRNGVITHRSSISRYLVAYYIISIVSLCCKSQDILLVRHCLFLYHMRISVLIVFSMSFNLLSPNTPAQQHS